MDRYNSYVYCTCVFWQPGQTNWYFSKQTANCNLKRPCFHSCFSWMTTNRYMNTSCFTMFFFWVGCVPARCFGTTLDCNPWWSHAICSWTSALLWGQVWGAFGSWRGPRSLVSQNPSRNYWPQDGPGSSCKWGERTIINGFALGWTDPRGIPPHPTTGSTRPTLVVDFEPRTTWFAKQGPDFLSDVW